LVAEKPISRRTGQAASAKLARPSSKVSTTERSPAAAPCSKRCRIERPRYPRSRSHSICARNMSGRVLMYEPLSSIEW
jgi:hypothetical protein